MNERLAHAFWPQEEPIGKGVRVPESANATAEVVGVVRDVKYQDLRGETGPMFYRPVLQTRSTDSMVVHVRSAAEPGTLVNPIREAIQNVNRGRSIVSIHLSLEEQFDASFALTRQAALMAGAFSVPALLLAVSASMGLQHSL